MVYRVATPRVVYAQKQICQTKFSAGVRATRVRPFRLKKFFAYKRNKAKLDPFHMCFACSLQNFTSIFSLLFASNFSLRFTLVIFASKRNKAKRNSSLFFCFLFAFFRFFLLLFFAFFHFFSLFFALNFSLRFDLVIFASKFLLHIRENR